MSSQPRARRLRGRSGLSAWDLALRPPSAHLKPFVHGDYVGYTERTPTPVRRREFPGPFVVMVIELGPPVRIYEEGDPHRVTSHRGGFVGGLCEEFAVCEHDGFQQGVQVNLTPIGARRLFDIPMSELNAAIFSIQDLLPARHRRLGERLANLRDWDARFDLLERTLTACLREPADRTRVISWAVRRIEEAGGAPSMRELARELGYSRKHVVSMFRDQVGIPPKALARIVRFHRLVQHFRGGGRGTWSDLALEFGYYDQAHLAHEVHRFTGLTPTEARSMMTSLETLVSEAG